VLQNGLIAMQMQLRAMLGVINRLVFEKIEGVRWLLTVLAIREDEAPSLSTAAVVMVVVVVA
jgi:hypothetical protein